MAQTLTHTIILEGGSSIVLTATIQGTVTREVFDAWQHVVDALEDTRPIFEGGPAPRSTRPVTDSPQA